MSECTCTKNTKHSCILEDAHPCCIHWKQQKKRHKRIWKKKKKYLMWSQPYLLICFCAHIWLDTSPTVFQPESTALLLTVWPRSTNFSQGLILVVCKHINWQLIWRFGSRCACKSGVWTWQAALWSIWVSRWSNIPPAPAAIIFHTGKQMPQMRATAFGLAPLMGEGGPPHTCSIHTHLVSMCWNVAENLFLLFRYGNFCPPTLGTWWCEGFINSCNCLLNDTTSLWYQ